MDQPIVLHVSRRALEAALSEIQRQRAALAEQIDVPLRRAGEQIAAGVWIGRGADAFYSELLTGPIAELNALIAELDAFATDLAAAYGELERADAAGEELVRRSSASLSVY